MDNRNQEKQNIRDLTRRKVISALILVVTVITLITVSLSWLKRNQESNTVEGAGFKWKESAELMPLTYSVETSYYGADRQWHSVSTDYNKDGQAELELRGLLIAGGETKFKTVVTSLSEWEQKVSVYLSGVSVDKAYMPKDEDGSLSPLITIGSHAPQTMTVSSSAYTLKNGRYVADTITLMLMEALPAGESVTVEWYIATNEEVSGGDFPALMQNGKYITETKNGHTLYWAVVGDETAAKPEACLANDEGTLTNENGAVLGENEARVYFEYPEDYTGGITVGDYLYGDSLYHIDVDGLYIMVG